MGTLLLTWNSLIVLYKIAVSVWSQSAHPSVRVPS